jgi:hypothetical protein
VPHVTVVAANPVEGLRALAAQRDVSFQVFLWRAYHYLNEQFRDVPFERIKTTMDNSGAKQLEEWGEEPDSERHGLRYAIQDNVLQSRVGRTHTCIVELQHYRKPNVTQVVPSIRVEFASDFKATAAKRDYPKGTVLDRVFGLRDLERRAKDTPRLDTIEVSYGPIGYLSTPGLGHGFHLDVSLSNPSPRGRLRGQRISYMACSGLDPLGTFYTHLAPPAGSAVGLKPAVHVARDTLVAGAPLGGEHERGYPDTFGSAGGMESPREAPTEGAK